MHTLKGFSVTPVGFWPGLHARFHAGDIYIYIDTDIYGGFRNAYENRPTTVQSKLVLADCITVHDGGP